MADYCITAGKEENMKKFFRYFTYFVYPLLGSMVFFVLVFTGLPDLLILPVVPILTALLYVLFRKKHEKAAAVNGWIFMILLLIFTFLMCLDEGNLSGSIVTNFLVVAWPFLPLSFYMMLVNACELLYATILLTYAVAFFTALVVSKAYIKLKKGIAAAVVIALCLTVDGVLYMNRPQARYAGHGFAYMNGFSSTDFKEYMVYSDPSRLAALDHPACLTIENEQDMPVMDGAEACYPLYAAIAKAVYKDIDVIEKKWAQSHRESPNGKIVSFTNTIVGFERLVLPELAIQQVDLFFGARPSADQKMLAEEYGIEIEVTPIGREAFVFFVEEDNPVSDLTSEQIKAIYHGNITNWQEVGGKNQEIVAFQRPKNSGSQTMMEYFMSETTLKEPKAYETVDAMSGVITHVAQYANEAGALGYSFRYFLEGLNQEKHVKLLSVDGVYPSLENIENGSYPLTTSLCLITRKNDPNPYVQQMVDFILSEDGQSLIRQTGYAGLSAD